MITVYIVEEDGTILSKLIEKSQLLSYKNLGWTEEKPVDFAGAIADTDRKVDIPFGGGVDTTPSPFGYPSLVPDGQGGFIDVNVYLNGINSDGQWYYPGDEDRVLDEMLLGKNAIQDIKTLQDRLVRTQWLSTEDYSREYGRPSASTRSALIKAMTASNYISGAGYDTAIDIELLNPFEEIYVPKAYRESDKASRLQTVDAIFSSIGRTPTKKERNYYEVLLKDLEQKEFYSDEAIARMAVEGPEVTTITTPGKVITEFDEEEGMINIVGREPGTTKTTVEPIPEEVDSVARLQERIKGDFEGVLARQQDVARARNNAGSIAQSIMRLKALGG
jgi:hypothetical protein